MSETQQRSFNLSLRQTSDYEFTVRFDDTSIPELTTDEGPPLGAEAGPDPSRLLATAVGNCLASSLLFALRKFKNSPSALKATVRADLERNDDGRWRIVKLDVQIELDDPADSLDYLDRALAQFEDFCVVTQSVRQGIAVSVSVLDREGTAVHTAG